MKITPEPVREPEFLLTVTLTELRILRALVGHVNGSGTKNLVAANQEMFAGLRDYTEGRVKINVRNNPLSDYDVSLTLTDADEVFGE